MKFLFVLVTAIIIPGGLVILAAAALGRRLRPAHPVCNEAASSTG